ncbi:unnamed protein product [Prorocentrum cordatum]|uniref:Subtilisin n=1 Tax=Prorocentrum cordatum TaxID=2364126 RepID=A0ABN9R8K4_9DINO|nr:unnamed protein product [Polarella glacialis]
MDGGQAPVTEDVRRSEMVAVHFELADGDNIANVMNIEGSGAVVANEESSHAEVATGLSQVMGHVEIDHAAVDASTTRYLAKDTCECNTVEFAIGEDERLQQCAAPCCADPGNDGCQCATGCPDQILEASVGVVKCTITVVS